MKKTTTTRPDRVPVITTLERLVITACCATLTAMVGYLALVYGVLR